MSVDDPEVESLQQEELEVLDSIYEGDPCFTSNVSAASRNFQYKYGEDGASKSFVLDLTWGPRYPHEPPKLSMETFYNRHVLESVKEEVVEKVLKESEQFLGMSMTYSLFEFVKEKLEELLKEQPDQMQEVQERVRNVLVLDDDDDESGKNKPKKEQLTKAQKRRMWDKGGLESEERPRGWNWMDVIRHLSQTGGKEPD